MIILLIALTVGSLIVQVICHAAQDAGSDITPFNLNDYR